MFLQNHGQGTSFAMHQPSMHMCKNATHASHNKEKQLTKVVVWWNI
jgi:hypothetical protein